MATNFKDFVFERKMSLLEKKSQLREEISEHVLSEKGLFNNHYRLGSEAFFEFINEAKVMYAEGTLDVSGFDRDLLESNIGEWAEFGGEMVPLDIPMINEENDDNMISDREKEVLKSILKKVVTTAQQDMKNAAEEGHEDDMQYFKAVSFAYRKLYRALKMDIGWTGFIRMFNRLDDNIKTEFTVFLRNIQGPDAHAIRNYFAPITEAEYKGRDVELGKPMKNSGGSKPYKVYVKSKKGNVKELKFGSGGLKAKINDPEARKNFASRHNCDQKNDKTSAGYWSCRLPYYADQLGLSGGGSYFW